ncbi:MAG TPA: VOC family protein [Fimbriiglobus sp.]|nr:VOC family protein [Fimbriiglobus sp.]
MTVKPIPDGYHTVTPYFTVRNAAAALEFYKKAFGAVELMRFDMPDGGVAHAEIQIGDSKVMFGDECPVMGNKSPQSLGGTTGGLCIYVANCDAMFAKALATGATVMKPMADQFYGDRSGTVIDPFGHAWTIATHKEDVSLDEMKARMAALMQPQAA